MALTSAQITALQSRYTRICEQIELANTTFDGLVANQIESFSLNTGEGSQASKRWEAAKLQELSSVLERRRESIYQRLTGLGLLNMNVRRKGDL